MRRCLTTVSSAFALALLLSVAFAGLPDSTQIQSDTTVILTHNGQTFEVTSVDVEVQITFQDVSPQSVEGTVSNLTNEPGEITIRWVEGNVDTTIPLSPLQPDQTFGLEGGDGDKRHNSGPNVN